MKPAPVLTILAFALTGAVSLCPAETIQLSASDDWFAVLNGGALRPGDEVVLAPGTYSDARRLEMAHRGTEGEPVVIRSADPEKPAILTRPDGRQNVVNLGGAQHLVLRDLEITGGDAAIRIFKAGGHQAEHITLEGLHIHHIGGVGVTANSEGNVYEGLVFRRNHIHHTGGHGEAFYLGCNNAADGSVPGYVAGAIIEGNYLHDLKGGTVSQGDGIEIKDGSYGCQIRDNIIRDTNYPGIIVYSTHGKAPNVIERNAIWNAGDHGIQAGADAVIRNNIIYGCGGDGIRSQPHQAAKPGNLRITHNTVVAKGGHAIRISPAASGLSGPAVVANNVLIGGGQLLRLPDGDPKLTAAANDSFRDPATGRIAPKAWAPVGGSPVGKADLRFAEETDFWGRSRASQATRGAVLSTSEPRNVPDGHKAVKE
ncbi:MAG: right-handed parallel beta-helix repeat-containing protein [Verrucomicrobiales bacterium]